MSDKDDPNWGKFVGIGFEFAIGVGLGYFVGSWLDRKYGWGTYGTLVGVTLGFAGGLYLLIKEAARANKD